MVSPDQMSKLSTKFGSSQDPDSAQELGTRDQTLPEFETEQKKIRMKRALGVTRIICGILVFATGLANLGVFGFEPPVAGPDARQFQLAMHEAGYFMPVMTALFLVAGASFITNLYAALLAAALFPVSINILLYHTVLEAGELPAAIVFFAINCFMLWYCREAYAPLLKPRL
jgi:hypothetical protein